MQRYFILTRKQKSRTVSHDQFPSSENALSINGEALRIVPLFYTSNYKEKYNHLVNSKLQNAKCVCAPILLTVGSRRGRFDESYILCALFASQWNHLKIAIVMSFAEILETWLLFWKKNFHGKATCVEDAISGFRLSLAIRKLEVGPNSPSRWSSSNTETSRLHLNSAVSTLVVVVVGRCSEEGVKGWWRGGGQPCYSSCLKVAVIGNGDIQCAHISLWIRAQWRRSSVSIWFFPW